MDSRPKKTEGSYSKFNQKEGFRDSGYRHARWLMLRTAEFTTRRSIPGSDRSIEPVDTSFATAQNIHHSDVELRDPSHKHNAHALDTSQLYKSLPWLLSSENRMIEDDDTRNQLSRKYLQNACKELITSMNSKKDQNDRSLISTYSKKVLVVSNGSECLKNVMRARDQSSTRSEDSMEID
ncbi:hypothetical protein GUITHDRAFT_122611 [Guillardia theta CCMP2712]|uniref:Uncharacterized protein n=1 Tax=Guillardia theta (strain CCMP2712) TaxID=905079 RepID=L1I4K7_GUITC|nr:hypothetical protein GUITHDRAFT_122611 [Guillardia theta CCMP2712]EKX31181.1 hypothetical protein GUITHDRAFT_122611 [Guillardia theta CCMP2712]|eukprot:XP_005818161.1 hypothetical protein GUITHDRAFT_122611 [Guillardia theta CCMP2712]